MKNRTRKTPARRKRSACQSCGCLKVIIVALNPSAVARYRIDCPRCGRTQRFTNQPK